MPLFVTHKTFIIIRLFTCEIFWTIVENRNITYFRAQEGIHDPGIYLKYLLGGGRHLPKTAVVFLFYR
jgi:hypothetical protein